GVRPRRGPGALLSRVAPAVPPTTPADGDAACGRPGEALMANGGRKKVAVFGAGIAGLTAAHELIERGFDVTVYEKTPPLGPHETTCGVGGMARTQIGRV